MRVTLIPCGPAANESELKSFAHVKQRLESMPGDDQWILLTNLAFSVTNQFQSDEIDLIVIGPAGIRVLEIKYWSAQWLNDNGYAVDEEAERVTRKAKKIAGTVQRIAPDRGFVQGAFLLSQDASKVKNLSGYIRHGVPFYTLNDWIDATNVEGARVLTPMQVRRIAEELQPRSRVALDGSLRRLAGYINLELQTPKDQRFHRVYKGSHPSRRDRVVLHLYDLSASDDRNAEQKARREADVLQRLQLFAWAPRILDSWQAAPGYPGEMFFFTVVDPAAPSIHERADDQTWAVGSRVAFARGAVQALMALHEPEADADAMIHRNLTPATILVKHDNTPILTGFERSHLPAEESVASSALPPGVSPEFIAPEVQSQGMGAADTRSDLYSLCASLGVLFQGRDDELSRRAATLLERGLADDPKQRAPLLELDAALGKLLGESTPPPAPPPARFWTEEQVIRFRERDYRIVSRLGSGGVGTAFKVVELDRTNKEELGTFVAKVAHEAAIGRRVLRAYSRVRPYLSHPSLSIIYEVAADWEANEFIALLKWVSGAPLSDYLGIFPLLAEEQQEPSSEALALRWLRTLCDALDVLHHNGLIHGDISPRNLIVSGSDLVLTDYDFVTRIGDTPAQPGTVPYASPTFAGKLAASPADDFFALAASFFHVLFEKDPFLYGAQLDKQRGLNWEGIKKEDYPILAPFLDRATHPDASKRFARASEAIAALKVVPILPLAITAVFVPQAFTPARVEPVPQEPRALREERVEWLRSLLQSYPGSLLGNRETRGLDTDFAAQTYVATMLEETLLRDIRERRVRLVVLCGNAGDGKTALLQHLANRLGLGAHSSAERILSGKLDNGVQVHINLDGSAAWRGRSADELLDEFLAPFQDGHPADDRVHLLAINDGRLLEWIRGVERRRGGQTVLTSALDELLLSEGEAPALQFRFVNLNQRSLVGGINADRQQIQTEFLERLIDRLYGGERAAELWAPCQTCSAQDRCSVFRAANLFGPDELPSPTPQLVRLRARQRLAEALQAVHLRGEVHITMRELRAALVYILFGISFCDTYHAQSESEERVPYWDRAFAADAPARQGEVLDELVRYDPAQEAHPQIDRHLQTIPLDDGPRKAPPYPRLTLASARRRAYFEWTPEDSERVTGDPDALDLARGRHLREFRGLPLAGEAERTRICAQLCMGISRLEDLPPQALDRSGAVPLRVTPRTPTETAFWVEKPLSAFRLEVELPPSVGGIEQLHRQATLVYTYRSGQPERLQMGAELFHLLLELADGYQLGDVSTDDTFAHLSIFVQRLVREDERTLMAWNPMQDEAVYRVSTRMTETERGMQQQMIIAPLVAGGEA